MVQQLRQIPAKPGDTLKINSNVGEEKLSPVVRELPQDASGVFMDSDLRAPSGLV